MGTDESGTVRKDAVNAIFDREIKQMENDLEPFDPVGWFLQLRDEVLDATD